jgi:hypothetical protein
MESTVPPVFSSYAAMYSHSLSGSYESKVENGSTRAGLSPSSLKITTRCRLLGFCMVLRDDHSKPMRAVNRPGSLCFSAASIWRSQTVRIIFGLSIKSLFTARPFSPHSRNAW